MKREEAAIGTSENPSGRGDVKRRRSPRHVQVKGGEAFRELRESLRELREVFRELRESFRELREAFRELREGFRELREAFRALVRDVFRERLRKLLPRPDGSLRGLPGGETPLPPAPPSSPFAFLSLDVGC